MCAWFVYVLLLNYVSVFICHQFKHGCLPVYVICLMRMSLLGVLFIVGLYVCVMCVLG